VACDHVTDSTPFYGKQTTLSQKINIKRKYFSRQAKILP